MKLYRIITFVLGLIENVSLTRSGRRTEGNGSRRSPAPGQETDSETTEHDPGVEDVRVHSLYNNEADHSGQDQ